MINPLKATRLGAGLTQEELADAAKVSRMVIVRVEQGLYPNPPGGILSVLARRSKDAVSIHSLIDEYHTWQLHHREQVRFSVPPGEDFSSQRGHPFLEWRLANWPEQSQIGFCKMLAVPASSVAKYESGRQRLMPEIIYIALNHATKSNSLGDTLAELGVKFFDATHS